MISVIEKYVSVKGILILVMSLMPGGRYRGLWFGTKLQLSWVIHCSTVCSSGFAVETEEDQIIKDNAGKQRKM